MVLASEVGGRWGNEPPPRPREVFASSPRTARCHYGRLAVPQVGGFLSCAQQWELASTLLGGTWRAPAQPGSDGPAEVVEFAEPTLPCLLPLRAP